MNPRYQRVQNADSWIDHRPPGIVPTGTILQPQMQPRKLTIRKLTKPKDFVARSSRYCLVSQEQDTDGELETKLYKVNSIITLFFEECTVFIHIAGRRVADLWRRGTDHI